MFYLGDNSNLKGDLKFYDHKFYCNKYAKITNIGILLTDCLLTFYFISNFFYFFKKNFLYNFFNKIIFYLLLLGITLQVIITVFYWFILYLSKENFRKKENIEKYGKTPFLYDASLHLFPLVILILMSLRLMINVNRYEVHFTLYLFHFIYSHITYKNYTQKKFQYEFFKKLDKNKMIAHYVFIFITELMIYEGLRYLQIKLRNY